MASDDGISALVDSLRAGELESDGIDCNGDRVAMSASLWRKMTLTDGENCTLVVCHPRPHYGRINAWRDIQISRDGLLSLWPAPTATISAPEDARKLPDRAATSLLADEREAEGVAVCATTSAGTVADATRLRAWLLHLMRSEPDRAQTKAKVKIAAQEAGHRFSDRTFNRQWANAVEVSGSSQWSRPGRKS